MDKSAGTSEAHSQAVKRTEKRPDPIHGFLFQLKLLMLFLYRGINGGYSFLLGTEIEEAKKFDDLVFEFTDNNKKFYRLLQAKHKFDISKNSISAHSLFKETDGEFHLPKYFFSYLDAKKESLFKGGIIKDVIICTNINFNDQDVKSKYIKIEHINDKDDILEIKVGCLIKPMRYKFKEEIIPVLKRRLNNYKSKAKRILSEYDDNDIKDFINHFIFAVDCPNEQELGEIIKGEIGKEFDFHNTGNIYNSFMMTMLDWLQGKERGRFISDEEGKQFFEEAKKGIPVLFNIRCPVESFTGRTKELDILHEALKVHSSKTQAVCISGIGGVGKSELARKYISEFRMEYNNNVLWFNAESYQSLEASFRSLASDKLGIATKNADGEEKRLMSIVEDVYRAFSNRYCLMIFDNAQHYRSKNEFDEGIDRFLPPFVDNSSSYIIITSRNQKWPTAVHVLSLSMFEKDEALRFISKVLKASINDCLALADEMHYFPLGLQQAVSYIKVQHMKLQNIGLDFSITSYLNRLKEKAKDVLNFSFPDDSDTDYTKTVYITWNVTLDMIRKSENGNEALEIMNILSYMAPEDIPVEIFLNLVNDYDVLSSALDILKQYSMITIHRKIISLQKQMVMINVHGLVQEVIRLKLVEEGKENLVVEEALNIFTKRENVNNNTLDHAISVWGYSCKDGVLSEDKRRYSSLISTYICTELLYNRRFTELHLFGQKAIDFSSLLPRVDECDQSCLAILTIYKGFVLNFLGNYNNSKETFQEALSSSETVFGKDDELTKAINISLAQTLLQLGSYNEAIKLSTESLGGQEKMSNVLILRNNLTLASALRYQGEEEEVVLDILREAKKNQSQTDSTDCKILLANILHLEGNHEEALHLYQSLDCSKDHVSPEYDAINNFNKKIFIAQIYMRQMKFPEAFKEFNEAVDMGRNIFSGNHPTILWCQCHIAELLRLQTKFDEAVNLFEETYEKQKNALGKDHLHTLETLSCKGKTLEHQGKLNDSLKVYQEVLKEKITKLGKDHPSTFEACTSVGDIYHKMKDYDQALEKYNEVLFLKEKKGKAKVDNLALKIKIGKVYFDKGEIDQALPIFIDALKLIKDTYGYDHADYPSVSTDIARIYLKQEKYDLALEYFRSIYDIKKKKLGENHPDCLFAKHDMAYTLFLKKEFYESLKLFHELLNEMNGVLGNDHPRSLSVRNNISKIYRFQDKYDEAVEECKKSHGNSKD